jgi:hypothetical protein
VAVNERCFGSGNFEGICRYDVGVIDKGGGVIVRLRRVAYEIRYDRRVAVSGLNALFVAAAV